MLIAYRTVPARAGLGKLPAFPSSDTSEMPRTERPDTSDATG